VTRAFTAYWAEKSWSRGACRYVEHAASDGFGPRDIAPGDQVFIVHYQDGSLFLGARLPVERVCTKAEAAELLQVPIAGMWDARYHVMGIPQEVQRLHPHRQIPIETVQRLQIIQPDGSQAGLTLGANGVPTSQSMRGVLELTSSSAAAFNALIEWEGKPKASEVLAVSLSRGPCNGTCPVYSVMFRADGRASWEGEYFVERLGKHTGNISPDAFSEVADVAVSSGFFSLDRYTSIPPTCVSGLGIEVMTGVRDKSVESWGSGEPEAFVLLADQIDRVAESLAWRPVLAERQARSD
jgi:hypothetical protein